jgi:hypothetical protein
VTPDLDTLLIGLYVEIDDHVIPSGRRGPGQPKKLSDAELVCLAVAQVLLGARSERHWLRLCYARLGHLFPYLPKQPGYHKRLKAAGPLLAAAMDHLARQSPSWHDQVRLIDATPVPCGTSRETVRRSELAGWAGYGYCAAHSRWYWGLKLYLITTPDGMPVAWCLATPKTGEREVAAGLLAHAARNCALRPGLILIGDKGFAGREFEDLVTAGFGLHLVRPGRRDEAPRHGSIGWIRQVDRIGQRHPEGPARPGTTRRPDRPRRLRPHHPAAAGHGRCHLAQLGDSRTRQAVADRLRQLNS